VYEKDFTRLLPSAERPHRMWQGRSVVPPGRRGPLVVVAVILGGVAADLNAEWWTTSEVAAYLGVQVATVTNYRKRGQMPTPDMTIGRTHVWRPARIVKWHQARPRPGVGGRPKPPPG
jgi:hypothetical protein